MSTSDRPAGRNGRSAINVALLLELTALEVDYWYDVDNNWGRVAHTFYAQDGVFAIGDKEMKGMDAVKAFYSWREGRGDRAARHIVTNFRLGEFDGNRARFECILSLYAADGKPVLETHPPIMIADIVNECERGAEGWVYKSHILRPIFMGGAAPTIPQN